MLIAVGQICDTMDVISSPSDEFAERDSRILAMREQNFQRLAGKMLVVYTSVPVTNF